MRSPHTNATTRRVVPTLFHGAIALAVATLALSAALFAVSGWGPMVAGIAALVAAVLLGLAQGQRSARSANDIGGLADVVEQHRHEGALTEPVAVVVIELRGLAADTLVDGAASWSEPIAILARRMLAADLGPSFSLARIAPHAFGAVFVSPDHESATAAAESLVAMCRVPVATEGTTIRIDAVAGVGHADVGERCTGDELIRMADAAVRFDVRSASPVATADSRLLRHARRVIAVETEIRHSLDVDLIAAKLVPVVDVRTDIIVGVRSAYDWTAVSRTDPGTLESVASSLGLQRSVETQYLMRSIDAANSVPVASARRVVAQIDARRLADPRAVGQIGLLLHASGIDPSDLVLEFSAWEAAAIDHSAVEALTELGVGLGLAVTYRNGWDLVPDALLGNIESLSVPAWSLIDDDSGRILMHRVEKLLRLCDEDGSRITVCDVDNASWALEFSAAGLINQCGVVHGSAMPASSLGDWLIQRNPGL